MATLKPLRDKVIVERKQQDTTTASGIVLPEMAKDKPQEGVVIAVGPGKPNDNGSITPISVKPGDKIIFSKYGPNEVKVEGKEFLILDESDIWAIVE
jgi:chaperonin GroES